MAFTKNLHARQAAGLLVFLLSGLLLFPPALTAAETRPSWGEIGDSLEETQGRGLVIRSNPTAAKVYIDGIERGNTPLRLESIQPGQYFVRLEKDGYVERRFRVTVHSGGLLEVSIALQAAQGQILVKVKPAAAAAPGAAPAAAAASGPEFPLEPQILADGAPVEGPVLTLPEGFRTIKVRAFGWEEMSQTVYVKRDSVQELEFTLTPAVFRISAASLRRSRFNPANSGSLGTTGLVFEVSGPGRGMFAVLDSEGKPVYSREAGPFTGWNQELVWDGRDSRGGIVADGVYSLKLTAQSLYGAEQGEARAGLEVAVNSSLEIRPLSLSSGKAGLLFAPSPAALPAGSFQIEGSLLFGSPPESGSPWTSLPFAGAFRASVLDRLEISGALSARPVFSGGVKAGVSGGAKWVISNPAVRRFGSAAGLVVSWADKTALTPFGAGSGIELFLPLSLAVGGDLSLLLTPACLWTGDEGYPWEPSPRLLVSGGVLLQKTAFAAGVSARSEYRPWGDDPQKPSLMLGGEIKFFPPPSRFVFSLMGGAWIKESSRGGFGGVGIGMIY